MTFLLKDKLKTLFQEEACVFSFAKNQNSLEKDWTALNQWLDVKANAHMKYLEKNLTARKNPELILPQVQTAIIFLFPYSYGKEVRLRLKPNHNFLENSQNQHRTNSVIGQKLIAKYVYGKDYHKSLKKRLNDYAEKIKECLKENFDYRAVVDSIPFLERAHAREAGLGFVGKNTMLIRPGMGSFFFIATLLTTLSLEKIAEKTNKKSPMIDLNCGTCTKCLDACPTQALEKEYFLNANKCLSYLSIEHRDLVPQKYLPYFKDTLYGCDICQDVCPYNLVTLNAPILPEFASYHKPFQLITAEQIACMTQEEYINWFGGTAATRAKYEGLVRNALYHLYAVKHIHFQEICQKALHSNCDLIKRTAEQLLS